MSEPPDWPPEIDAALATAREPEALDSERKAALWRRIEDTTEAPAPAPPRRAMSAWVLGTVAAVAAAVLLVWLGARSSAGGGELDAKSRVTVRLQERGVAVAEQGTKLRWQVGTEGAARVTQSEGRVFYRVEPGGTFTVSTPAGQVDVTGTSFEVHMKKKMIGSAAMGGAVAAAMVVAVYEGKVVASNAHGQVQVAAGEQVEVVASRPPAAGGSRFADTAGEEQTGKPAAAASTQQLNSRVRELERQLAEAREANRDAEQPSDDDDDDDDDMDEWQTSLFEPTQEMLLKAAEKCRVQWAAPAPAAQGDPHTLKDGAVERIGLTADERAAIDALTAELNDEIVELTRKLYTEATGDESGVADLSFDAMRSEIFDKASDRDATIARTQVSHELAGMSERPSDPGTEAPATRILRAEIERAHQFSEGLSRVLGVQRAREVRTHLPLNVHSTMGCEGDE